MNKNKKGFTLLEILLAVAALVILAGIVILAINPAKQLADTRNAERWMEVNQILNATYQYTIDNGGNLPTDAPVIAATTEICKTGVVDASCVAGPFINLKALTTNGQFLVSMPTDPKNLAASNGVGYTIAKDANGRLTVCAPNSEASGANPAPTICVTR